MHAGRRYPPHIPAICGVTSSNIPAQLSAVIRQGIAAGEFRPVDPLQFIPSMVALNVFYFSSAPVMRLLTRKDPLSPARVRAAGPQCWTSSPPHCSVPRATQRRTTVSGRKKFFVLLGVVIIGAMVYYLAGVDRSGNLVLIGTVDANQVIVSTQIQGRIQKLLVDEGTQVSQGNLIAVLDPELEAQERAAAATLSSLRSKVRESQYTEQSPTGPPRAMWPTRRRGCSRRGRYWRRRKRC